jgi:signal peptidase I
MEGEHIRVANSTLDGLDVLTGPIEEIEQRVRDLPPGQLDRILLFGDRSESFDESLADYYGIRIFRFEGASMETAIANNDVFAVPAYEDQVIVRWEIIVFEFPLDPDRHFLKRVVALPGETVEVRDGDILINGAATDDAYEFGAANYSYGPKTVPEGHYFVLGDNRRNSFDSHAWGNLCAPERRCDFVPEENIIGVLPPDAKGRRAASDDPGD